MLSGLGVCVADVSRLMLLILQIQPSFISALSKGVTACSRAPGRSSPPAYSAYRLLLGVVLVVCGLLDTGSTAAVHPSSTSGVVGEAGQAPSPQIVFHVAAPSDMDHMGKVLDGLQALGVLQENADTSCYTVDKIVRTEEVADDLGDLNIGIYLYLKKRLDGKGRPGDSAKECLGWVGGSQATVMPTAPLSDMPTIGANETLISGGRAAPSEIGGKHHGNKTTATVGSNLTSEVDDGQFYVIIISDSISREHL